MTKLLLTVAGLSILPLSESAFADESGSTIVTRAEVEATLAQGLDILAEGSAFSDIVMRHIDVDGQNMGVSVVQRAKVEFTGVDTAIAHVSLDEIYYVLAGEGTMVTGGEFINSRSSVSALVGPILRGEIRGGVLQSVEPGDIAIIPKGMPHGWHEITTDTISYIIFRGDPDKVMSIKKEL